jgi:tetratricopeptide (TPR) repeat protein
MTGRAPDRRSPSTTPESDLLARLGLGSGASNAEIEAAHDEILDFLAAAPGALREWAELQLTDAEEAYAQLNGAPPSGTTTAAPLREARASDRRPVAPAPFDPGFDELYEGDEAESGPVPRRDRRASKAQSQVRGRARGLAQRGPSGPSIGASISRSTLRKAMVGGVAVLAVLAIALGVYGLGGGPVPGLTGTPKPQASGGVDAAKVAELMQRIATNDKDVDALLGLATLYYGTGDYAAVETWLDKVLAIDPQNVPALLTLGAAQYNTGDETSAEANWRKVLQVEPDNIEAHYDLGFMYFSQSPPNDEAARVEWGKVVELAPDSDLAQTVAAHLAAIGSSAPAGSGGPTGSGAPTQSSAPTGSSAPGSSATPGGS